MENSKEWLIDYVPIIQQDLSKEDTIHQISYAFGALESIASQIFDNIQSALDTRKARLSQIKQRCSLAQSKVDKITGINKSVKVVSSCKYPIRKEELIDYSIKPIKPYVQCIRKFANGKSLNGRTSIAEKLKFYHVKEPNDLDSVSLLGPCPKGLGSVPKQLNSVSNLVLFNRNENIFQNYKIVDPLQAPPKQHSFDYIYKEKLLEEPAPTSINAQLDWLNYRHDRHFFYSPAEINVTNLQAPQDLPDLPGIASDLQYSIDPQLTNSSEFVQVIEPVEIVPVLPKLEIAPSNSEPVSTPPPPPPPPPPPLPIISVPAAETNISETVPSPVHQSSTPQLLPPNAASDQRANLMEAIRKAGGSSVLKRSTPREPTKRVEHSGGQNLMSELHNKLSMRRKGISGKFDTDTSGGIIDKIVAMIPPPPSKAPKESDSDEEWDD